MTAEQPTHAKLLKEFKHDAPLAACAFDPTGRWVFAGAWDNGLHRWELASGQKTTIPDQPAWISVLAAAPNGKDLFAGDYAGRVVCWSMGEDPPRPRWTIDAHAGTVRTLAIGDGGKLLASGGKDGKVRLWSADEGKLLREFDGHTSQVFSLAFHPDGLHLYSGERDNRVKQWELATGKLVRELPIEGLKAYNTTQAIEYGGVRSLACSMDGTVLACSGRSAYAGPASLVLLDQKANQPTLLKSTVNDAIFHTVLSHSSGEWIAGAGGLNTGELWFWKPGQEKPLATIKVSGPALRLDLDREGRRLLVAQSLGVGKTYPESGVLGLYELVAK